MTEFQVDPDELDALAGELRRRSERLAEGREGVGTTARTVAERWSGEAQERFVGAHAHWDRQHRAQVEALVAAAEYAEEAASTYREVDRAIAETFS